MYILKNLLIKHLSILNVIRHQLTVSANSVTVEVKIPTGYSPCDEATMGNTKDKRCLDEVSLNQFNTILE